MKIWLFVLIAVFAISLTFASAEAQTYTPGQTAIDEDFGIGILPDRVTAVVSFRPLVSGEFTIGYGDNESIVSITDNMVERRARSSTLVQLGYNYEGIVTLSYDGEVIATVYLFLLATPSLDVLTATDTTITLWWTAVDNADSYTLTRIVDGDDNVIVATGDILTATDTGLSADTDYKYTITATNTAGTSGSSNEVTARTDAATPPAAPALRSGEITSTSIEIAWGCSDWCHRIQIV